MNTEERNEDIRETPAEQYENVRTAGTDTAVHEERTKSKEGKKLSGSIIKRIAACCIAAVGLAATLFTSIWLANSHETTLVITMLEENRHVIFDADQYKGYAYRYGPSIIRNENGVYEALFSTNPGPYRDTTPELSSGAADVLTYRTSSDGGMTWSDEVLSLIPTRNSPDRFSVCDPTFIKVGDWYYAAYTATFDSSAAGVYNHVYAARTKTPADYRSWEKWNGKGWSAFGETDCAPIVHYYGSSKYYGIGEPSLVYVDGNIYLYYTYTGTLPNGAYGHQSRVAVGRMDDELWPLTLADKGPVLNADGSEDSVDVKYIDDLGLFVSLNTYARFTRTARVKFMVSQDGLLFKEVQADTSTCIPRLHNSGLAGDAHGHIQLDKELFVMYAYSADGKNWGHWSTAVQYFTLDTRTFYNKKKPFEKPLRDAAIADNVKAWSLSDINEYDDELEDLYSADKAVDNDADTFFFSMVHSSAQYNEVLAFRTDGKVKGVTVTPAWNGECFPAKFKFQYSKDGLFWHDVEGAAYDYTQTPVTDTEPITFPFASAVKADFIRLVATELTAYNGLYALQIAEIHAF